jgi:hypothetical protein
MQKSFILVVMDHDNKKFSVEGPMRDDRPWNDAVLQAQDAGRDVRCFSSDDDLNPDSIADRISEEFRGYIVAPRGSIVRP